MSRWDKLIQKILSLSRDVSFDEIKKVLEAYGYKDNTPKGGSSHHIFRKAGHEHISIPKSKNIKLKYVIKVKVIIEEESKNAYS